MSEDKRRPSQGLGSLFGVFLVTSLAIAVVPCIATTNVASEYPVLTWIGAILAIPVFLVAAVLLYRSADEGVHVFLKERVATKANITLILSALIIPVGTAMFVKDYRHTQIQADLVKSLMDQLGTNKPQTDWTTAQTGVMATLIGENKNVFGLRFVKAAEELDKLKEMFRSERERTAQQTLSATAARAESLKNEVKRRKTEISEITKEIKIKDREIENLRQFRNLSRKDKNRLATLQADKENLDKNLKDYKDQLKNSEDNLQKVNAALAESKNEIKKLKSDLLNSVKQAKKKYDELLAQSDADKEKLSNALADANATLGRSGDELQQTKADFENLRLKCANLQAAARSAADYYYERALFYDDTEIQSKPISREELIKRVTERAVDLFEALDLDEADKEKVATLKRMYAEVTSTPATAKQKARRSAPNL